MKNHRLVFLIALTLAVFVPAFMNPTPARAVGSWVTGKACIGADCRDYKLFVPSSYNEHKPLPLLVMLHGCLLDPDKFDAITRMSSLAEENEFFVLYPQQPTTANAAQCWNWFLPVNQARGSGEASIVAEAVKQVRTAYKVHPQKMYVAGLSAGAAMAVIMGSTYPDLFPSIGVAAGLEFKAGTDLYSGVLAMQSGGPDPVKQGYLAYQAMGRYAHVVRVMVFQGTADTIVNPVNGTQVITQWATTDDYADDGVLNHSVTGVPAYSENGTVPGGYAFTRYVYNDAEGDRLMEKWMVTGMSHAWPGGTAGLLWSDPKGPNASLLMCQFFRLCK